MNLKFEVEPTLDELKKTYIEYLLSKYKSCHEVAKILNIFDGNFSRMLKNMGIDYKKYTKSYNSMVSERESSLLKILSDKKEKVLKIEKELKEIELQLKSTRKTIVVLESNVKVKSQRKVKGK
jgi:DNA gyrase/topoisomerase IV subunit A